MAKKIYSEEKRRNYCEGWSESGLNKSKFSQEQGISESALRKWLKKYGYDETNGVNLKFLEVEPINHAEKQKVEIQLPNGLLLKTEVESISKLIKELSL